MPSGVALAPDMVCGRRGGAGIAAHEAVVGHADTPWIGEWAVTRPYGLSRGRARAGLHRTRYVTIRAHNAAGRVVVQPRRTSALVDAVIAYAGPLAEARAAWLHEVGDDFDTLDEDGFGFDDYEGAAWLLGGHQDLEPVRVAEPCGISEHEIRDIALGIVERRWPEIDTLATALLATTHALSYGECLARHDHRETRIVTRRCPTYLRPRRCGQDALIAKTPCGHQLPTRLPYTIDDGPAVGQRETWLANDRVTAAYS